MTRRDRWSGRAGFILATVASAVGLGSIWKFPYEVGSNGGGAFVLFYLLGLVFIVMPLMFAEFAIGRRGKGDATTSIERVAAAHAAGRWWALAGAVGILTAFLILSFYSVIGGWTIAYALETALKGLPDAEATAVRGRYEALMASPWRLAAYHAAFMAMTGVIVARGISGGIEAAAKILMPILFALMIALALYGLVEGDVSATVAFLFRLDPSGLTARAALEALGLGFFSIGVGLSLMITYAGYAGPEINLRQVAIVSVIADTAISFMAGLAVFPIVFAHGLDPAAGAGLVFVTLPLAFAGIPFGTLAAVAFFVLLFVAALGSAISMLEMAVAMLVRRFGWSRPAASAGAAAACFLLGLFSVLSFNHWSAWFPLRGLTPFAQATFFDLLDHLTSNLLLPLAGLALALFAGWALPAAVIGEELSLGLRALTLLRALLRYVAPLGITAATFGAYFAG